jgi:hypothetical protein
VRGYIFLLLKTWDEIWLLGKQKNIFLYNIDYYCKQKIMIITMIKAIIVIIDNDYDHDHDVKNNCNGN